MGCTEEPEEDDDGNVDWEFADSDDPCCNYTLQWAQCCMPGTMRMQVPAVGPPNSEFIDSVFPGAHSQHQVKSALKTFARSMRQKQDPNKGCAAIRRKQTPDDIWDRL